MDGLEATRRIRATWPPERQPHIIALTADVIQEQKTACQEAGMDAFVSKPINREALSQALLAARRSAPAGDGLRPGVSGSFR